MRELLGFGHATPRHALQFVPASRFCALYPLLLAQRYEHLRLDSCETQPFDLPTALVPCFESYFQILLCSRPRRLDLGLDGYEKRCAADPVKGIECCQYLSLLVFDEEAMHIILRRHSALCIPHTRTIPHYLNMDTRK